MRVNDLLHPLGPDATVLDYLRMAREAGCSDLHLTVGRSPFVRYQGSLIFIDDEPLSAERSEQLNFSLLSEAQQAAIREQLQLDFAYEEPGLGRHRCNVYRQRIGWEGEYRIVPSEVPSLESLNLPPVLQRLTEFHQGLVLVTGPAGCGKTTTVAAMLNHINRLRSDHIITVEDPVEYVIEPVMCQVTHREVGQHTQSFANALRAALRQDPDVISIGELRDLETTSIAISAAETGHLVFGTLHTNSALRTVARVMDVYPPAQRAQICTMVAESMRGVLSQQLVPRRDGNGRVCAMEVLIFTSGVAQLIKEGKTHQLVSAMQSGKRLGMRTMDDALMELVDQRLISGREAYARSENKPAFEAVRNQD
jgi:twitching motility protein PilT